MAERTNRRTRKRQKMILYIHELSYWDEDKIVVTPINVKETDKLFKVIDQRKYLPGCKTQIYKTDVGKLKSSYGYNLIDFQPDVEMFKSLIEKDRESRIKYLENELAEVKKFLEKLKTVEVVIKEVQENER